jgi:hypothetical protein
MPHILSSHCPFSRLHRLATDGTDGMWHTRVEPSPEAGPMEAVLEKFVFLKNKIKIE